jgi:hypothetical protein
MTLVKDIFEADSIELHDLRDNPNTIIKIQGLVSEWLEANDNRKLGIRQLLVNEYGVSALPGVISATYILNDRLSHTKDRERIGALIAELCADNSIAQRLLLRVGIVDNPLEFSRQTAFAAITSHELILSPEDRDWLAKAVKQLVLCQVPNVG